MSIKLKDIYFNDSPEKYIPNAELVKALEVAYALKKPLLISGEPGTGKTSFARWVANTLQPQGFHPEPFIYNTKSSSVATDLLYYYDAVSHFRESQTPSKLTVTAREKKQEYDDNGSQADATNHTTEITETGIQYSKTTADFIELKALGLAFAQAVGLQQAGAFRSMFKKCGVGHEGSGAVVLIDEVDKASRDFANDLLNEVDRYSFEIKEINKTLALDNIQRKKVIIILTSNLEKSLPEAFLRRCVYYHIPFPTDDELAQIVMHRLNFDEEKLKNVMIKAREFLIVRSNDSLYKKPSTAEFIDWIRVINDEDLLAEPLLEKTGDIIANSPLLRYLPVLLKRKEDMQLFLKTN